MVLALLVGVALAACGEPECPARPGLSLCGYCDEDRLTSDNPHAGMCTYCEEACGDDPCHPRCDRGTCDASWVDRCGQTEGGVQFTGQPWPMACGACPEGTHRTGEDRVSAGGPYYLCTCDGL